MTVFSMGKTGRFVYSALPRSPHSSPPMKRNRMERLGGTGEEARAYGIIDHVITDRDDLDKLEAAEA